MIAPDLPSTLTACPFGTGTRREGAVLLIGLLAAGSLYLCASPAPAAGGDQGTGTYTASGTTYTFDLLNNGTTAWQYFYVVAPSSRELRRRSDRG